MNAATAPIAIVDYGMGNRRSVEKALEHVGARAVITSSQDELRSAAGVVVPGVGAFPRAMENLRAARLDTVLVELVRSGVPTLGICLGMQLALDGSDELGGAEGLGLVAGRVRRLDSGDAKLPHIGWNEVRFERSSALTETLPERGAFYHVHSYAARPEDPADVLATADYGTTFVTAIARGAFYGVQFHPEKSSTLGLRLLAAFASLCRAGVPA
ncbi:MAG TPA: imidazole glycerol phosphate synthase subunit HisH [Solirubrobacteraceae bacterium]|nr:imidazole glycerol phosphate synthase subunit HisH [Solirubrobacteraceae bacterium]